MIINGKKMDFELGITVTEVLKRLELPNQTVVVELNLDIVPAEKYNTTTINEGDKVEIVKFVGGG
ncbi:sulfur carrier protein ThiS [Serpentinicella sp. ANB-PHB4]|uniref:sulfur carrier protein ThiS n=1 Tax=Serpentinicella sp. ANB-PHB4 TaxID=3074076 RepID=UPI0028592628|nr:sulfur carrier protein ThiS [Serpentinicella sp. ANB-PHB4]MDR5658721.1 sulfur carrier protein ThiS [Serpentinicella sp. ANB-PHB4]